MNKKISDKDRKDWQVFTSNKDKLPNKDHESIIEHEEVHIDQIKRGDLWYDDEAVYWKGKKYPRSKNY